MRYIRIILLATVTFLAGTGKSEIPSDHDAYNVKLWQMEDGLPNNNVQAITQTKDGYLWVGTREGLARFDGVNFKRITLLPERPSLSISCLHESRDGALWVGTDNNGLFRLYTNSVQRYPRPDGKIDFDVRQMEESGDGKIWITSSTAVLCCGEGKLQLRGKLKRQLQGICADENGAIWTLGGALTRLDNTISPSSQSFVPPKSFRSNFAARSIYYDRDKHAFWLADEETLVELQNNTVTTYDQPRHPSGYISVIFRDNNDQLWVGTYLGLKRLVNGKLISQTDADAPQYRIYAIFEDRERNLWVGSEEGLSLLTPKAFQTITKKDGLTVNTVVSVCACRDGSVWISAWGGGLNRWKDELITSLSRTNGLSSDYIMAMTEGRDESLWAGADNGGALNHIKDGKITALGQAEGFVMDPSTATTALFEDNRGVLWIGSRDLLQCFDGKTFSQFTTKDGLSDHKINAIYGGAGDVVWIGTEHGLTKWQNGIFRNLASTNGLLKTAILSLYEDPQGILWLGTKGNGLIELKGSEVHQFTSMQGLFSDAIYAILEDNHQNLWLNSSRGIFRLDKQQLKDVTEGRQSTLTSISYGKADGILSSGQYQEVTQPSACKSLDGRLWFRTTQGVAVVDPEKLKINKIPPPVVIQAVIANKQAIDMPLQELQSEKKIVIPPGRGELEVHYEALSFCAPGKNRFRYKLEGVDQNWVEAGARRVAFYNNLSPQSYRFRVAACNNDGIWSEEDARVSLIFQPFFWQTWWFLSLMIILAIASIAGGARYVTYQRMRRRLELLARQNAVEKERTRIARDMHDELGAKLTRISFLGNTAKLSPNLQPETSQQITKMSEAARELILSLDQIVWAVDPENDSLENLANYICRYAGEFTANGPVQCKLNIPWKLPSCSLSTDVRHNVFLAVKEALNNAVKHSGATEIAITIAAGSGTFEVAIADNGRGLPLEQTPSQDKFRRKGRGLENMRERLKSINGEFFLTSHPGNGTEIRLRVPWNSGLAGISYVYPN